MCLLLTVTHPQTISASMSIFYSKVHWSPIHHIAWISNFAHIWDVTTTGNLYSIFNGNLAIPLLKLGHDKMIGVITYPLNLVQITLVKWAQDTNTHTHTHTHIYIYIYIYITMKVVFLCMESIAEVASKQIELLNNAQPFTVVMGVKYMPRVRHLMVVLLDSCF